MIAAIVNFYVKKGQFLEQTLLWQFVLAYIYYFSEIWYFTKNKRYDLHIHGNNYFYCKKSFLKSSKNNFFHDTFWLEVVFSS